MGPDHVFMDVQDIQPGADFAESIEKTVALCDVLVAVIGPRWLELLRSGRREQDFVEHEILSALRRGVTVIPVLVGGASMPAERELPAQLAPLARRQAVSIRDSGFDQDASDLVHSVRRATGGSRSAKRLVYTVVSAGIIVALIGSAALLLRSRQEASLSGVWIARMQRAGQRPYNVRLQFEQSGRFLTGQVEYPTGSGAIEDGTFENGRLRFVTRHVPQFETQPAKIVFRGQVRGREVDLLATLPDGGMWKGTARKTN
jgi:hypothetical protein